jgi:organic radical activating enzyme
VRHLITFATAEYRAQADRLIRSARGFFDRAMTLAPVDIPASFYRENAGLFGHRRGFGYWCWKPLLILRELEKLPAGGELMYADSSVVIERDPAPLFKVLTDRNLDVGLFHQKREKHRNSTWTRGDCFRLMGCDEERFWDGDNLATTFNVWRRSPWSIDFLKEWLKWCCDERVVSDLPSGTPNAPDFRDHRHDQSIASLMAIRDDLFTLCDCSQFGDGYRCSGCNYPRILRVDRTVRAPWLNRPTMSSIIEISTVATCAIRCSYCPQDKLGKAYHGPKQLTLELFGRCLDNLTPGDAIYFAGFVEPALNPRLTDMIRLCLDRGHRTRLYTTGRGLSVEQAGAIAQMPLDLINLHLPDAQGHLSHRPETVPVLDALAKGPAVEVMAMDNTPHSDVVHLWNSLTKNMGQMHDRAGNLDNQHLSPFVSAHKPGPIRCRVAPQLDHSVLLPDGRLALCCMDYGLAHIVGELSQKPYSEIIRGKAIAEIRQRQLDGRDVLCRRCVCSEEC